MKWFAYSGLALLALFGVYLVYTQQIANPRVVAELQAQPNSPLAARVALVTFADGKQLPINYLREGNEVFLGADGPWWRSLREPGARLTLLMQGESVSGNARVELENQAYVDDVFARLRPAAPDWLPDWLNGKLVIVTLDSS